MSTNPPTNGKGKARASLFPPSQAELRKRAERAPTRHYQSGGPGWYGYGQTSLDGKPYFTWFDIPRMMVDPKVRFISQLWRAPFQKVQFTVKASSPKVAAYVQNTIKRFWRVSLPQLLVRYFQYGFCAGGAEFDNKRGGLRLDEVKAVECRDVEPRVWKEGDWKGQFAGFFLQNSGGGNIPKEWVGSPHAFYFAGLKQRGQFYDDPPLLGLFEPWLEKNQRGGAVHMRRLWFAKNASHGMQLRYPPGVTNCGTDESPQIRDNQDLAREIVDYAQSNSTIILENTREPSGDDYEWIVEHAEGHGDVAGFLEYPDKLDEKMVEGAGIPLEVIQGSDSGSGYKGRLVSYGGFLGTVDEMTGLILKGCDTWLEPAVLINYGPHAWYEIEPVSLSQIASEEEKRQPTNPVGTPLASLPPQGGGQGNDSSAGQFQASGVKTNAPPPFELSTLVDRIDAKDDLVRDALKALTTCVTLLTANAASNHSIDASKMVVAAAPSKQLKEPKKYSCVYAPLSAKSAEHIKSFQNQIDPADLCDDGFGDECHVTVRYGLHGDDCDDVRYALKDAEPFGLFFQRPSVFSSPNGKDYDVIKLDVVSDELPKLHEMLGSLPHTDDFKDYHPHCTVAYVKKGLGQMYVDRMFYPRKTVRDLVDKVVFSDRNRCKEVIVLGRNTPVESIEMAATASSDDNEAGLKEQVFNQTQQRLMRTRKSTIAQLLALAMLRKQQEATQAGKPEAAAGSMRALAELAGDPIQVARIVGMKEMSTWEMSALELAWTAQTGPRGGTQAINSDTGRILYGQQARDALANQQAGGTPKQLDAKAAKSRADVVLRKLSTGASTPDDLRELASVVPSMKVKDIRAFREVLKFNLRGERNKKQMMQRLLDHVDKETGTHGVPRAAERDAEKLAAKTAPKVIAAEVGPDGAKKPIVAAPDKTPASGVAVVGPDGTDQTPQPQEQPPPAAEPPAEDAKPEPKVYQVGQYKLPLDVDTKDDRAVDEAAQAAVHGAISGNPADQKAVLIWASEVKDPDAQIKTAIAKRLQVPRSESTPITDVLERGRRRTEFLKAKRGKGESPQDFALKHYPELKTVQGLKVEGADTEEAKGHVHDLFEMGAIAESLGAAGVEQYISDKSLPETDSQQHNRGLTPRGWPEGSTFDSVGGGYVTAEGKVISGVGQGSSDSTLGHESGHAVGDKFGLDNDPELVRFHKEIFSKLNPYLQQDGPGGFAGRQELLAESIASYVKKGKESVGKIYSPEYAEWLETELKKHGGVRSASAKTAEREPAGASQSGVAGREGAGGRDAGDQPEAPRLPEVGERTAKADAPPGTKVSTPKVAKKGAADKLPPELAAHYAAVAEAQKLPPAERDAALAKLHSQMVSKGTGIENDDEVTQEDISRLDAQLKASGEEGETETETETETISPLSQKASKAVKELEEMSKKVKMPQASKAAALKRAKEAVAALPAAEQAKYPKELRSASVKSGPVFSSEERAAEAAKVAKQGEAAKERKKLTPLSSMLPKKAEPVPESQKEPVADKVAEKLATVAVKADKAKKVAPKPEKSHSTTTQKVASVSALVKNPGADRDVLKLLAQKYPEGSDERDYLVSASHNIYEADNDVGPKERRRDTLQELAELYLDATKKNKAQVQEAIAEAVEKVGGKFYGAKIGASDKFDGRYFTSDDHLFTDDPGEVVRQAIVLPEGNGKDYVALKGVMKKKG